MSDELKKKLGSYIITSLTGLMMTYITMSNYGIFEAQSAKEVIFIISSALSIPGVIIMMIGCLVWVSKDGFFDGISYAFSYTFKMMIPGTDKTMSKYKDYIAEKAEKRAEKKVSFAYFFIVGGVFLVLSVILLIIFYMI